MSTAETHNKAFVLLPWFVNGTLGNEERELVEGHVKQCLICHAELKAQRQLLALVAAHPTVHISAEQSLETLLPQLDRRGQIPTRSVPWLGWLTAARTPQRFSSVFGALAMLALVALFIGTQRDDGAGSYRTLASASAPTNALRIDVVFTAGTSASEIQDIVADVGGRIVAGPSDVGRYTIAVDRGATSENPLPELLERLQRDPRVRFASRDLLPSTGAR